MGKLLRLATGFGIIGLGVCAALPFRRPVAIPLPGAPAGSESQVALGSDLPLQVPGQQVPDARPLPEPAGADSSRAVPSSDSEPRADRPATAAGPRRSADSPRAGQAARTAADADAGDASSVGPAPPTPSLPDQYRPLFSAKESHGRSPGDIPAPRPRRLPPVAERRGPATAGLAAAKRHTIRDGDTLKSLALRYWGDESLSRALFAANRQVLEDPELLPIGVKIVIPPDPPRQSPPAPAEGASGNQVHSAPAGSASEPASQAHWPQADPYPASPSEHASPAEQTGKPMQQPNDRLVPLPAHAFRRGR
jgi:phage tail protein X